MKSILKILVNFLFASSPLLLFGQWEILNDGIITYNEDFLTSDNGWATGLWTGTNDLLKTTDGGKNWSILNQDWDFDKIEFFDNMIGWASCDGGILKTVDGGQRWDLVYPTSDNYNVIYATSTDAVYLFRNEYIDYSAQWRSHILMTSNGGSGWNDISPDDNDQYYFYISSAAFIGLNGVVEGQYSYHGIDYGMILETPDDGATWNRIKMNEYSQVYNVILVDNKTAFFLAEDISGDTYYLCKTTDWFDSRSVVFENNDRILAFNFFDNDNYITIMEQDGQCSIMKSSNGGYTWRKVSDKLPGRATWNYKLFLGPGNAGTVILSKVGREAPASMIMRTADRGETWNCTRFNLSCQNDINFISRDTGLILSHYFAHSEIGGGYVFNTENGGNSWIIGSTLPVVPQSCLFLNNSVGFISTLPAGLYQTTNGGLIWEESSWQAYIDAVSWPAAMDFVNENTGYLTFGKKLFKTTNRGEEWNEWLAAENISVLNSLFFFDENTGWAIGNRGEIFLISTKGWVQTTSGTSLPLTKVFFANRNTGWIAGGYGNSDGFNPIFLKTVDGGVSWAEIVTIDYLIHDMYFSNALYGWAVGEDRYGKGCLLATDNGGINWYASVDDLPYPLTSINFREGVGWAVGNNGLMLRNESVDLIDAEALRKTDPGRESLLECYPNPFRSETVISYKLLVTGYVEINIYDYMGRRVSRVVNEKLTEGSYKVTWDAKGFKPGIYFCELKTTNNRVVQKMVLLK